MDKRKKFKKVQSNLGEDMLSSCSYDGVVYYSDGIVYEGDNYYSCGKSNYIIPERDGNLSKLRFFDIKSWQDDDNVYFEKEELTCIVYNKENKSLHFENVGLGEGLELPERKLKKFFNKNRQVTRAFVFEMLKNEPFYDDLMHCVNIKDPETFYRKIIELYLTDSICLLSFLTKFKLNNSLNYLLNNDSEDIVLANINSLNESIIYRFCDLLGANNCDCLSTLLEVNDILDKNEMELLYKLCFLYFISKKTLNQSKFITNKSRDIKYIMNYISYIRVLGFNLTEVLNTIVKELYKNYRIYDFRDIIGKYKDYLSMSKEMNEAHYIDKIYPVNVSNIESAHDEVVSVYNMYLNENNLKCGNNDNFIEILKFKNATEKYSRLAFEDDEYIIMIPTKPSDLINEGHNLHHCVGGYVKYVISGKSKILLCRKKSDPCKSYMTIEVLKNEIVQAKKYRDSYPNEEDKKFIDKFCKAKKLTISGF